MAENFYSLTEAQNNVIKFNILLIDIGREVFSLHCENLIRKIGYNDIKDFFKDYLDIIKVEKDNKDYSFYSLFQLLLDTHGNISLPNGLENFDIQNCFTVLEKLLLNKKLPNNMDNTKKTKKEELIKEYNKLNNCKNLKEIRNVYYGHICKFEMDNKTFQDVFGRLKYIFQSISEPKSIPAINKKFDDLNTRIYTHDEQLDLAKNIEEDILKKKDFLNSCSDEQKNRQDLIDLKNELNNKLNKLKEENLEFFEKINIIINSQSALNTKMDNVKDDVFEIKEKVSDISTKLENINLFKINNDLFKLKAIDLEELYDSKEIDQFYLNILILSKTNEKNINYDGLVEALGQIRWKLIFDLDPKCEIDGFGIKKNLDKKLEENNLIVSNRLVKDLENDYLDQSNKICFYVFSNGNEARNEEEQDDDYNFKNIIFNFMNKIINLDGNKKIRVTNFFLNKQFEVDCNKLKTLNEMIINSHKTVRCKNPIEIINLIDDAIQFENNKLENYFTSFLDFCKKWKDCANYEHIQRNCFDGLYEIQTRIRKSTEQNKLITYYELPKNNSTWILEPKEKYKYEKEFQVFHKDIGASLDPNQISIDEEAKNFLAGNMFNLRLSNDREKNSDSFTYVIRDIFKKCQDAIKSKQQGSFFKYEPKKFTIFHEPSSGASTLVKLLLYDFREKIPCIQILRLTNMDLLIDGLDYISKKSDTLPLLLLIDDAETNIASNYEEIDQLMITLEKRLIKAILIYTQRVIEAKDTLVENCKYQYLLGRPSDSEQKKFKNLYDKYFDCNQQNENLLDNIDSIWMYGLAYLADKFEKLETIVEHYADKICSEENLCTLFYMVCIYYKYCHKEFPSSIVSQLLSIEPYKLEKFLVTKEYKTLNNDEKVITKMKLLIKFFSIEYYNSLNDDNKVIGIRPYNHKLGESLIKNIVDTKRKSNNQITIHNYVFDRFEYLVRQIDKSSANFLEDLKVIGMNLFIEKSKENRLFQKSNQSIKNNEEISTETFFSYLIYDALYNFPEEAADVKEEVAKLLRSLYKILDAKTSLKSLAYRIGAVSARFTSFYLEDKAKGIEIMKKVLNITENIEKTPNHQLADYPRNSDLLATYGNLIRYKLVEFYFHISNRNNIQISDMEKKDFLSLAYETINACKKSTETNPDNPISYHCEILTRQKILTFFYKFYCFKDKKTYSEKMKNKDCDKIVYKSEGIISKLIEKLEYLVENNLYSVSNNKKHVFLISQEILKFRMEIKNEEDFDLEEFLEKNPMTYNVFNHYSFKQKNQKEKIWSDLNKPELKKIIDICEKQIEKDLQISSNFKDLLMAIIQYENDEYHLDIAIDYCKKWINWLSKNKDNYKNKYENDLQLAKYLESVFYLIKSLRKDIKENEKRKFWDIASYLKVPWKENYAKGSNETRFFKTSKDIWKSLTFYICNGNGLQCLKPSNKFEIKNDTENNLKVFKGPKKSYYYEISEINSFKAYYHKYLSHDDNETSKEKHDYTDGLYNFKLMIRPDKIYVIKPKKN